MTVRLQIPPRKTICQSEALLPRREGGRLTLSHNHAAHEDLNRPDSLKRDLPLASRLVHAELMAKLILGDGIWVVNLVSKNHKGNLCQLLHGKERVQLGLSLGESFVVLCIDEEDDTIHFREVVLPEATSYRQKRKPLVLISLSQSR